VTFQRVRYFTISPKILQELYMISNTVIFNTIYLIKEDFLIDISKQRLK